MRQRGNQPVIADQIVGQADAAVAKTLDEAAAQRIAIAEQSRLLRHQSAIVCCVASVHRWGRGRIGLRIVHQAVSERCKRARYQFGIAIDEDECVCCRSAIEDEAIPAARLAAFGIFDQFDPARGIGADDVRGRIAAAIDHHHHAYAALAQRKAVEACGDTPLFIMGQDRNEDPAALFGHKASDRRYTAR